MSSHEPPYGQSAAYQLGKLDAQLHAEREARKRAEQSNVYLLEILVDQRTSLVSRSRSSLNTTRDKPGVELAQQLLDASEQRIEELKLELKMEKLKVQLREDNSRDYRVRDTHTGPSGIRAVRACSAERSRAACTSPEPHQEETETNKLGFAGETDIPIAEWMYPAAKVTTNPVRVAKTHHKSYFTPSSAPVQATGPTESFVKSHPGAQAAANYSQTSGHEDGAPRFGRFERDYVRPPRSHGRPPPNPRPYYSGNFPYHPWPPRAHPHLPPRPPFAGTKLVSYADLDRPAEPPLPLHDQPSSGYMDFKEDLYDERPSTKVNDNHGPATAKPLPALQPLAASHGLKQSIHARSPYWPVFTTEVHKHRHVDIKLPSADAALRLLKRIGGRRFLLSATPPAKTVRVVSPTAVETSYKLTLEFARGDVAAELVRALTGSSSGSKDGTDAEDAGDALVTKATPGAPDGCSNSGGRAVEATRRGEPSEPIPREIGEAVWCGGAGRALVIDKPGAALRVPANLRYQIESCPYTTGLKGRLSGAGAGAGGGGEAECGGRLQGTPEFLQDGSIRLVFWDVRDAIVAFKTWSASPLFREVDVSYEREGALPVLDDGAATGEEETGGASDAGVKADAAGVAQKGDDQGGEDARGARVDGKRVGTRESTGSVYLPVELEKEEDDGYAAGSSDDMENSIVLSPRRTSPKEEGSSGNHPSIVVPQHEHEPSKSTNPRRRPGTNISSSGSDIDIGPEEPSVDDRDAPDRRAAAVNHDAVLDYDDASERVEDGEIRESQRKPSKKALSSEALPAPPSKTRPTSPTLADDGVPIQVSTLHDHVRGNAGLGEGEGVSGKATRRPGQTSQAVADQMSRSRWAAMP